MSLIIVIYQLENTGVNAMAMSGQWGFNKLCYICEYTNLLWLLMLHTNMDSRSELFDIDWSKNGDIGLSESGPSSGPSDTVALPRLVRVMLFIDNIIS